MKYKFLFGFATIVMVTMFASLGKESKAQDWPQWRGPNRDDISKETGLNLDWSANKPPQLWVFRQAGSGYSSPTIVGNTLYCQGAADSLDFAFALDTKTGRLKWKQTLGSMFIIDRGNGPRGSITVDGDKLYFIRGGGQLHCLAATDGRMLWQKDFRRDLGGNLMSQWDWGFSESPLVDGDLVICTPGGSEGTMAALNKNTGEIVWRSKEWMDFGGFSSPVVAEVDEVRQYIQLTRHGVAGISASEGKLLWSANVVGNKVAVIPSPLYRDNLVYITSGYNAGCACLRLTREGDGFRVDTVFMNNNISNHHGGVVMVGDYIYGYSDGPGWVCQSLLTGERVWQHRVSEPGKGSVTCVDDRLLCLDEKTGSLTCAMASPDGWKEFGRLEIPERTSIQTIDNRVWTHPVVANGKLYLRDHDLLFCFDLKNTVSEQ